jgi:8-oxo-dGTP diphosphatase
LIKPRKPRYHVIPRTLIFLFNNSDVLLIKQNQNKKPGFGKWNGIGGHIERGEEPFTAAKREIGEETGLIITKIHLNFITIIPENEIRGVCLFIFSGYSGIREIRESKEGQLKWICLDELIDYPIMADLPRLLELIQNQNSFDHPQILSYLNDEEGLKINIVN